MSTSPDSGIILPRQFSMFVHGTPAPQGSKRGFVNKRTGRVNMVEQSQRVGPWREAVVSEVVRRGPRPFLGAVAVAITFWFPRPKKHYRANGEVRLDAPNHVSTTPDIDKLLRSTFDALTQSSVIVDDKFIVKVMASQRYADPNVYFGANIEITEILNG